MLRGPICAVGCDPIGSRRCRPRHRPVDRSASRGRGKAPKHRSGAFRWCWCAGIRSDLAGDVVDRGDLVVAVVLVDADRRGGRAARLAELDRAGDTVVVDVGGRVVGEERGALLERGALRAARGDVDDLGGDGLAGVAAGRDGRQRRDDRGVVGLGRVGVVRQLVVDRGQALLEVGRGLRARDGALGALQGARRQGSRGVLAVVGGVAVDEVRRQVLRPAPAAISCGTIAVVSSKATSTTASAPAPATSWTWVS